MKVIALLISLSLLLAGGFLFAFFKALKSGQFDDLESPAMRIFETKKNNQIKNQNNAKGNL
jgi:cbb3-type cytochrome oxidase maturation protein